MRVCFRLDVCVRMCLYHDNYAFTESRRSCHQYGWSVWRWVFHIIQIYYNYHHYSGQNYAGIVNQRAFPTVEKSGTWAREMNHVGAVFIHFGKNHKTHNLWRSVLFFHLYIPSEFWGKVRWSCGCSVCDIGNKHSVLFNLYRFITGYSFLIRG